MFQRWLRTFKRIPELFTAMRGQPLWPPLMVITALRTEWRNLRRGTRD